LSGARVAGIVERVKNILLTPKTEWPVIAGEAKSATEIYFGYVAPLVAIGVVAGFIGSTLIGYSLPFVGTVRTGIGAGLGAAITSFVLTFLGVFLISLIIDALAPTFGGQKNQLNALKVAAYSFTPGWIAGIVGIFPFLGVLAAIASLYGLYLLYLGLPVLMRAPQEKSIGYTVVIILCTIVVYLVVGALTSLFSTMFGFGAASVASRAISNATKDADVAANVASSILGGKTDADKARMKEALATLEKVGRDAEQAQKPGGAATSAPDLNAALGAVGTMMAGGKEVRLVDFGALQDLLPNTLPGNFQRTGQESEATNVTVKVASTYSDGANASITLEVADIGAFSGLAALASKFDPNVVKETADGYERTRRVDGQLVHEQYNRRTRSGELDALVGDRFAITARGDGVEADQLAKALKSVDRGKLAQLAAAAK
jgi:hypothetical protein